MISRRSFHWGVFGGALATQSRPVAAQEDQEGSDFLTERGFVGPDSPLSAVGPRQARATEVQRAFQLMMNAPNGNDISPLEVAEYFRVLEDKNEDGELYREEWKSERANPVVTGFFTLTNLLPNKGDQTAWCAAFANWCLAAANRNVSFSAAAQSFHRAHKNFEVVTGEPKVGDVAVFSRLVDGSRDTYGHVGFLAKAYSADEGGVHIIGGNQQREDEKPSTGIVSRIFISFEHPTLQILSFKKPTMFMFG